MRAPAEWPARVAAAWKNPKESDHSGAFQIAELEGDAMKPSRNLNLVVLASMSVLTTLILLGILTLPIPQPQLPGRGLYAAPSNQIPATNAVVDTPAITIGGSSATTTGTPTTGVTSARVIWTFGTVTGTYSSCVAQAQTSYDGVRFLNLGASPQLNVATGAVNSWGIYELPLTAAVVAPGDTSGIAVTPVSTTVASSFGQVTQFTFSCAGYGTAAPVSLTVVYR